jgi:hypothetical protein
LLQKEKSAEELGKKSTKVKLQLTREQLATILDFINESLLNPQSYVLYGSNCKDWVNGVLTKAGINATVDNLFNSEDVDNVVGVKIGPVFRRF